MSLFSEWIRSAFEASEINGELLEPTIESLRSSAQFREVTLRDQLGQEQNAITFDHELVGKFLASRHLRWLLEGGSSNEVLNVVKSESLQDVLFFAIDEMNGAELPSLILNSLLEMGGPIPLAAVAYAIRMKSNEDPPLPPTVREMYNERRLTEDLMLTPSGQA